LTTQLHLVISSESAIDALIQLVEIGQRAAKELGDVQLSPDTPNTEAPKGNGEDAPTKRTRAKAPPAPKPPSRDEIVKGLTDLFVDGDQEVRERITAFRDLHGVQRLRELSDEALPNALLLLSELSRA
jgi:hypothetical protein